MALHETFGRSQGDLPIPVAGILGRRWTTPTPSLMGAEAETSCSDRELEEPRTRERNMPLDPLPFIQLSFLHTVFHPSAL